MTLSTLTKLPHWLICGMVCLAAAAPALGAEDALDGIYAGKRTLTKGSSSPICPATEDVSVTIHGGTLTFTDSQLHIFALGFSPHKDESFSEIYQDVGGSYTVIDGRIVGDLMEADVSNVTCEHHWRLKKE